MVLLFLAEVRKTKVGVVSINRQEDGKTISDPPSTPPYPSSVEFLYDL